jgi:hypothetical protein
MAEFIRVETKSAWLSKINWTQAVGITASILAVITAGEYNIPPEQQVAIVGVIQGIQSVLTWVLKTWFTPTITPASSAMSGQRTMTLD